MRIRRRSSSRISNNTATSWSTCPDEKTSSGPLGFNVCCVGMPRQTLRTPRRAPIPRAIVRCVLPVHGSRRYPRRILRGGFEDEGADCSAGRWGCKNCSGWPSAYCLIRDVDAKNHARGAAVAAGSADRRSPRCPTTRVAGILLKTTAATAAVIGTDRSGST